MRIQENENEIMKHAQLFATIMILIDRELNKLLYLTLQILDNTIVWLKGARQPHVTGGFKLDAAKKCHIYYLLSLSHARLLSSLKL